MASWLKRIYDIPRHKLGRSDPVKKQRTPLRDQMNPDSGLLDRLLESNALTQQEVGKINNKKTFRERNDKILTYISEKKKIKELKEALASTGQNSVIIYLDAIKGETAANGDAMKNGTKDKAIHKDLKTKTLKTAHNVGDLPVDVLDSILVKSVLRMAATDTQLAKSSWKEHTSHVAAQLRTVISSWNSRIDTSWFRSTLRRHSDYDNRLLPSSATLVKKMSVAHDWVFGVARLQDVIYVLCQWSSTIRVLNDKRPFELLSEINLEEMKRPCDMAACSKHNRLYVTDSASKGVWKIELNNRRTSLWLPNAGSPFTLSVSSEGQVIIVSWGQPSCLDIYGPDGVLLDRLSHPSDIEFPLHAVQTSTGNFLVSHRHVNCWTWTISELTRDGQLIRRYTPPDRLGQLCWPRHISLDHDRVLVADCENDRVVVLDSKLLSYEILLTRRNAGIQRPDRIHYDVTQRQLLVGHFEGKIDIYRLTHR